jgi:PAS domain S-box-containing protein
MELGQVLNDAFAALIEGIGEAAFVADAEGRICLFSPTAEILTGRTAGEVQGLTCAEALGCLEREACPEKKLPGGSYWSEGLCRGRRAEGKPLALRLRTRALHDPAGRDAGRIAVFWEAYGHENIEKKLLAHQRLASLGELAASLVHEVGNPVSIILGFASLLVQQKGNDPGGEIRERILEEANRCRRIVEQLLNYARSSSRPPQAAPLNAKEVVEEVLALLSYQAKRRGVTLSLEWDPEVPTISADPGELKQVVLNLLLNGLEATESGGRIEITGRPLEKAQTVGGDSLLSPRVGVVREVWAEIRIEDEGPGLGNADPERLFAPFYTTKEKGGGLGLAVCRRLLRERGGDVRLESRAGKGARAILELPGSRR